MAKSKGGTRVVKLEVPLAGEVHEPVIFRLDMGKLSPEHRELANRVWWALREGHATLKSGKHVESVTDVVRWMFDQMGE